MQEKRLTNRLISYWQRLPRASEGMLPLVNSFNSATISDIWHRCAKLSQQQPSTPSAAKEVTHFYQLDFLGDELVNILGHNSQGQPVNLSDKFSPIAGVLKKVDTLLSSNAPVLDEGQFINPQHKVVKYRSCMLPFSAQNNAKHIILGLSWREF